MLRGGLALREEGHTVHVRVVYEKSDTSRFITEFLALENDTILVAAGGDGSINEVSAAASACIHA